MSLGSQLALIGWIFVILIWMNVARMIRNGRKFRRSYEVENEAYLTLRSAMSFLKDEDVVWLVSHGAKGEWIEGHTKHRKLLKQLVGCPKCDNRYIVDETLTCPDCGTPTDAWVPLAPPAPQTAKTGATTKSRDPDTWLKSERGCATSG